MAALAVTISCAAVVTIVAINRGGSSNNPLVSRDITEATSGDGEASVPNSAPTGASPAPERFAQKAEAEKFRNEKAWNKVGDRRAGCP